MMDVDLTRIMVEGVGGINNPSCLPPYKAKGGVYYSMRNSGRVVLLKNRTGFIERIQEETPWIG